MVWRLLFALFVGDPTDAVALRDTAPMYLTAETAADHLVAARVAGAMYDVDPDILLSIAWHESRYVQRAVTQEVHGKVSCGAMTPEPTYDRAACELATSSLVAGYAAGAHHLRTWIDAAHANVHAALVGYAGGYYLIAACRRDSSPRGCNFPAVILARAERIRDRRTTRRQDVRW